MIRSFYPYKTQVLAYTSSKSTAMLFTAICKFVKLDAKWRTKPREHGGDKYPYEISIKRKSGKGSV